MSWWDDVKDTASFLWNSNVRLPLIGAGLGPFNVVGAAPTIKDVALNAAALPFAAAGGGLATKGLEKAFPSIMASPPNAAYSTTSDRPRLSALDNIAPGTRHRTWSGGYSRGKTVRQVLIETGLKEGSKAAKALTHRKASREKKPSRRASTAEIDQVLETAPPPARKRRRSTKPPTRKQLAARRRFAAMARARRKRR